MFRYLGVRRGKGNSSKKEVVAAGLELGKKAYNDKLRKATYEQASLHRQDIKVTITWQA